jgi:cytochrome c-type biogenesis protein CcmH
MKTLVLGFTLAICLLFVGMASAQEGGPTPSPDEINAIAKNLYCPVCENVPLDACGTAACAQWRQQIADLLTEGYSEQEIYAYFQRYGASVLATPPASGFNWLIYVLPPALILGAAFFLWNGFQTWKEVPERKNGISRRKTNRKYVQQLEKDLKTRR